MAQVAGRTSDRVRLFWRTFYDFRILSYIGTVITSVSGVSFCCVGVNIGADGNFYRSILIGKVASCVGISDKLIAFHFVSGIPAFQGTGRSQQFTAGGIVKNIVPNDRISSPVNVTHSFGNGVFVVSIGFKVIPFNQTRKIFRVIVAGLSSQSVSHAAECRVGYFYVQFSVHGRKTDGRSSVYQVFSVSLFSCGYAIAVKKTVIYRKAETIVFLVGSAAWSDDTGISDVFSAVDKLAVFKGGTAAGAFGVVFNLSIKDDVTPAGVIFVCFEDDRFFFCTLGSKRAVQDTQRCTGKYINIVYLAVACITLAQANSSSRIDGQISDNDRTDQRTICQDVVDIIFSPVLGSLDPSIDQHNPFILCRFCRAGRKGEWAQAQDQRQDQSCHKKFFSTLFHRVFSFHTFISMV